MKAGDCFFFVLTVRFVTIKFIRFPRLHMKSSWHEKAALLCLLCMQLCIWLAVGVHWTSSCEMKQTIQCSFAKRRDVIEDLKASSACVHLLFLRWRSLRKITEEYERFGGVYKWGELRRHQVTVTGSFFKCANRSSLATPHVRHGDMHPWSSIRLWILNKITPKGTIYGFVSVRVAGNLPGLSHARAAIRKG